MFRRTNTHLATAALAVLMATVGPDRAEAELHGLVTELIFICGVMKACPGQPAPQPGNSRPPRPGITAEQRQQNRDVQSALNAFGWNVGRVDGSLGRNSRAGISRYQAYMGWNASGRLDDFQRQTLVDSWRKYQAGVGNSYPNMMAREGSKGLLRTALNPNYPAQYGDRLPGQPAPQPPIVADPLPQPAPLPAPALPPIEGGQTLEASMTSRCEIVELRTAAAMGRESASAITDADQALSEQFCDARKFAIARGRGRSDGAGLSPEQIAASCDRIAEDLAPVVSNLTVGTVPGALDKVRTAGADLGLADPGTAMAYGEICVGLGYQQDDATVALAGALVLTAAGHAPYGELVGHHMREGFGVSPAPQPALEWYSSAITALEQGASPAFEPSTSRERSAVIRAVIEAGALRAGLAPLPGMVPAASDW